ncbi:MULTISPECIES: solute carrier organic anion transporter [Reichenbachiella]|uniref:solute carrier organic anion transporter n=1 Tax=Reichenbachiella TaxID=156993 RepID=UPI0011C4331A|nr:MULTISPECIES: solute carrier organic anion transporter [Reichenbachiella]MBU2912772.1 hypothetical protein [Reichenbachiella agariperforans]
MILIFLSFSLIACREDDSSECNETDDIDISCVCPYVYSPVCGCNDKTYSNACVASCMGITDYTAGACGE